MSKIEFVEYTGSYPNLCRGELYVKIDGVTWHFGGDGVFDEEGNLNKTDSYGFPCYPRFWESGGCVTFDDNWSEEVGKGPWELSIYEEEWDDDMKRLLPELLRVFNENVKWGCCGGCV